MDGSLIHSPCGLTCCSLTLTDSSTALLFVQILSFFLTKLVHVFILCCMLCVDQRLIPYNGSALKGTNVDVPSFGIRFKMSLGRGLRYHLVIDSTKKSFLHNV